MHAVQLASDPNTPCPTTPHPSLNPSPSPADSLSSTKTQPGLNGEERSCSMESASMDSIDRTASVDRVESCTEGKEATGSTTGSLFSGEA